MCLWSALSARASSLANVGVHARPAILCTYSFFFILVATRKFLSRENGGLMGAAVACCSVFSSLCIQK